MALMMNSQIRDVMVNTRYHAALRSVFDFDNNIGRVASLLLAGYDIDRWYGNRPRHLKIRAIENSGRPIIALTVCTEMTGDASLLVENAMILALGGINRQIDKSNQGENETDQFDYKLDRIPPNPDAILASPLPNPSALNLWRGASGTSMQKNTLATFQDATDAWKAGAIERIPTTITFNFIKA
uniref:Uncharacterized protein n=1 Tax=Ditylenchus dipsaci TaxID=166011 RepID=A0A915CXA0_9BILA